jgi:collagenase-like PrtC family protease
MQITLGPLLFNWPADRWRDFYFAMADEEAIDSVVIGEIVCSKRRPFIARHIDPVVERLRAAGKTVFLGSLIMPSLERERRETAALAGHTDIMVEANDVSCLAHLEGRPHAVGPFVNVYNETTARYLAKRGAERICLPQELPLSAIAAIVAAVPQAKIEVQAFGRVPLAISARCYHARLHDLSKDNCRFICERDPDGLTIETLDRDRFLAMNGVQTLSHTSLDLLGSLSALADAGVAAIRLSPHTCDMAAIARVFKGVIDSAMPGAEASAALSSLWPEAQFSNGFLHGREGAAFVDRSPAPSRETAHATARQ